VRLKGTENLPDSLTITISIPFGAIKRKWKMLWSFEELHISIPFGAIKSHFHTL